MCLSSFIYKVGAKHAFKYDGKMLLKCWDILRITLEKQTISILQATISL